MSISTLCQIPVTYWQQVPGQDSSGGSTRKWVEVANFLASVQGAPASLVLNYKQRQIDVSHVFYTPVNVPSLIGASSPKVGDQVQIASGFFAGTYRVKAFNQWQNPAVDSVQSLWKIITDKVVV